MLEGHLDAVFHFGPGADVVGGVGVVGFAIDAAKGEQAVKAVHVAFLE